MSSKPRKWDFEQTLKTPRAVHCLAGNGAWEAGPGGMEMMESAEKTAELAAGRGDRRADPRHGVDEEACLLLVMRGSTVFCRLVDIGLGGCRICTRERFTGGLRIRVEVTFKVCGFAFRFSGVTQWSDGECVVGIRFVDVPERRREELAEAIAEIAARNAAKHEAGEQVETVKPAAAEEAGREERRQPVISGPASAARTAETASAKLMQRERRKVSREVVDSTAVIDLVNVASRLPGRILDLSLGGCRIRTDERFPVGIYTRVETEFHLEGLPFRLGGVIQAIHDRWTVGIRFLDMSKRKREQVEELMEDIREMKEQGVGNRE